MAFYNLIAEGKLEEVRKVGEFTPKSNAEGERYSYQIIRYENAMYHHVAMTTVIPRVCISRGMPQDLAYKISDAYIRKADQMQSVLKIYRMFSGKWYEAFCEYMSESTIKYCKIKTDNSVC